MFKKVRCTQTFILVINWVSCTELLSFPVSIFNIVLASHLPVRWVASSNSKWIVKQIKDVLNTLSDSIMKKARTTMEYNKEHARKKHCQNKDIEKIKRSLFAFIYLLRRRHCKYLFIIKFCLVLGYYYVTYNYCYCYVTYNYYCCFLKIIQIPMVHYDN